MPASTYFLSFFIYLELQYTTNILFLTDQTRHLEEKY